MRMRTALAVLVLASPGCHNRRPAWEVQVQLGLTEKADARTTATATLTLKRPLGTEKPCPAKAP